MEFPPAVDDSDAVIGTLLPEWQVTQAALSSGFAIAVDANEAIRPTSAMSAIGKAKRFFIGHLRAVEAGRVASKLALSAGLLLNHDPTR